MPSSLQNKFVALFMQSIARLPLSVLQNIGAAFGWLAARIPNNLKTVTTINIQLCFPELNKAKQQTLIKRALIETGKTAFEMPALWSWPNEIVIGFIKQVTGEENVRQALHQQKGIILLSPHIGAWEVINPYLAKHYPMVIMYKPAKQAYLDDFIHQSRERSGSTLVPTNTTGVKALYRALQDGKVVGLLPDQDPGDNGGEFAPFFNVPTLTMSLVSRLALKTGAPIFLVYAERLTQGQGYHLYFQATCPALADSNTLTATTALNQELEKCIRLFPAQYQWGYRRFKRRPPGMDKVY